MSALTDLNAAYLSAINASCTSTLIKARAKLVLEQLISAMTNHAALVSKQINSYSIGSRSVTYRNSSDGQAAIAALERQLNGFIYGCTTKADVRSREVYDPSL